MGNGDVEVDSYELLIEKGARRDVFHEQRSVPRLACTVT